MIELKESVDGTEEEIQEDRGGKEEGRIINNDNGEGREKRYSVVRGEGEEDRGNNGKRKQKEEKVRLLAEDLETEFLDHVDDFVGPSKEDTRHKIFRFVCLILGPAAAFPFLFNILGDEPRVNRCAGVTLWMAIWWMSEALPISFTALLPLVLFPLFGISQPDDVSESYFNDLSFLFMGTVIFASAMQRWNLHKRFALKILLVVGTNPGAVLFGFMFCTYFLSWWLSNSATAAMMLPVVQAVLESLRKDDEVESLSEESKLFSKAALIAVAYSSSIGGLATLTGTGTNLVMAGQVQDLFPKYGELSFAQWMLFAAPMSFVLLVFMWCLFYYQYARYTTERIDTRTVKQRYEALGRISFEELTISGLLLFTILLWLLREPPGCSDCGWESIFAPYRSWYGNNDLMSDGTVVLFTSFLMFFIPAKNRSVGRRLLEWNTVIKQLPWDILLLLGGGFALSGGFSDTNFTGFVAKNLSSLSAFPPYVVILLLGTLVTFMTEFTSNAAVASIMLPIVASTAVAMRVNPLFLMVPVCVSCSFAFCLPVATPANAMVFGTGYVSIQDMLKSGLIMNIFGVLLNIAWMAMAGSILGINLHHFPAWAEPDGPST